MQHCAAECARSPTRRALFGCSAGAGRAGEVGALERRGVPGTLSRPQTSRPRVRKMMEYYYADLLQYAVGGYSEPAGLRPGLLCEERRRGGGREANCTPI